MDKEAQYCPEVNSVQLMYRFNAMLIKISAQQVILWIQAGCKVWQKAHNSQYETEGEEQNWKL
jgi:hypothetical protein